MLLKNIESFLEGRSHRIVWITEGNKYYSHSKVNTIYKITFIETGEFYIGSTDRPIPRFCQHKTKLKYKRHDNWKLQRLVSKFGIESLEFEILKILPPEYSREDLYKQEQYFLDFLKPSLNISTKVEVVECSNKKEVHKFSIKGKFIKTYSSIIEASKDLGVNEASIRDALRGKSVSCLGFLWSYTKSNPPEIHIDSEKDFWTYGSYSIIKVNEEGLEIGRWNNKTKLLKDNPEYTWSSLRAAIRGSRKTYKGFIFKLEKHE